MHTCFPQGGCYTFEFDNVADRKECREFVGNFHSELVNVKYNETQTYFIIC
jgi:hypothetical protein